MLQTIFITGYRSFELGIFQEKDAKLDILKKALKDEIVSFIEEGVEWFLISGNLGIEIWAGQVLLQLKEEGYEVKLGIIFPFTEFGSQWNEKNKEILYKLKEKSDYVNATSHKPYESPGQLRSHTRFLLEHTQGTLVVYDEEFEGKPMWFYKEAKEYQEMNDYEIRQIDMYSLQNYVEDVEYD